jgi:redox-sensitive bicupin YhaK (pirin superfamily)
MIQIFPRQSRYQADRGWLQSNFSFSFAEYSDPDNMNFGPLRVLNDDFVAAHRGFGTHPHRDMEIVSIVISGELQHEDNLGNKATTRFGSVQRMSAGTGIFHSEMNPAQETVNFLQLWFTPKTTGIPPSYETKDYPLAELHNALLPIVSGQPSEHVAMIHQDLTIYLSKLDEGRKLDYRQAQGRKIFLFIIEGELSIQSGTILYPRDSARITDTPELELNALKPTLLMLIDLPS